MDNEEKCLSAASFFLRHKTERNGGNPQGKELGHLFLLTLLWWTKESGDERGRNPAVLKYLSQKKSPLIRPTGHLLP